LPHLELGHQISRPVHQIGSDGEHGPDREPGDDRLADADQRVNTDHRDEHGAERGVADTPERVLAEEGDRSEHDGEPRRDRGGKDHAGPRLRKYGPDRDEHRVAAQASDDRHVEDVQPQGRQPSVGEEQGLHREHEGDADHAEPGTDEDRREDPAEQVAAGPRGDGEVEHLHREHERGDQPRQRRLLVLHRLGGLLERDTDPPGSGEPGGRRDPSVDEPVRDVHPQPPVVRDPTGWQAVPAATRSCNSPQYPRRC
jgi:hypothetical protein